MTAVTAPRGSRPLWLALRLAATAGAIALWWLLADLGPGDLRTALGRLPPGAVAAGFGLQLAGIGVGAARWGLVLRAYGARRVPPVSRLTRAYLVGTFFNTFLPANVGGDFVRGHVTRGAFESSLGSYLVVLIERVFGLAGLFLLTGAVLLARPLPGVADSPQLALLGLGLAFGAACSPAIGRRIGRRLPGRLGAVAGGLPHATRPALLVGVLGLSVLTQLLAALSGWALLVALCPAVSAAEALVLVPVATLSAYLPTVAGLGVREAAFVVLFARVGVSAADATAASVAFLGVQLLVAAAGGLLHFAAGSGLDLEPGA